MPWDCNLNQDVHLAHDHHVIVTKNLTEDNPLKFSGTTPSRISKSYKRLVAPDDSGVVPSSKRIMHDITKIVDNLKQIYDAKGVIIQGLGDRKGKRFESASSVSSNYGGKRTKKTQEQLLTEYKEQPLHVDAQSVARDELNRKRGEWAEPSSINVPDVLCNSPETRASELTRSPSAKTDDIIKRETNV